MSFSNDRASHHYYRSRVNITPAVLVIKCDFLIVPSHSVQLTVLEFGGIESCFAIAERGHMEMSERDAVGEFLRKAAMMAKGRVDN